jgi:hypothetical protein
MLAVIDGGLTEMRVIWLGHSGDISTMDVTDETTDEIGEGPADDGLMEEEPPSDAR